MEESRIKQSLFTFRATCNLNLGEESFSVGISGEWGTGKTTFLNVVAGALEKFLPEKVATLVWFKPWDSSSPRQIVTDFFNQLVEKIGPQYSVVRKPMLKYAELLKAFDAKKPIVYFADVYDKHRERSIDSLKSVISGYLKSYGKIIPVLIDDMDRLSGDEIAEVLRLIRNTADFPNIVYITAYDKGYVEAQLQKKGIPNPGIYIEKFFSIEFALPKLEDYYQYNVFAQEVHKMCSEPVIISYVDRMPDWTQQFLCSAFLVKSRTSLIILLQLCFFRQHLAITAQETHLCTSHDGKLRSHVCFQHQRNLNIVKIQMMILDTRIFLDAIINDVPIFCHLIITPSGTLTDITST